MSLKSWNMGGEFPRNPAKNSFAPIDSKPSTLHNTFFAMPNYGHLFVIIIHGYFPRFFFSMVCVRVWL